MAENLTDREAMLETFPQFQQNFSLAPRMAWEVWKRGVAYGRSKVVPVEMAAATAEIDRLKNEVGALKEASRRSKSLDVGLERPVRPQ